MFNMHNIRPLDAYGSGEFGASRGDRTHVGTDFIAAANEPVHSPVIGTVTKLGYPYGDDLSFRYVEVEDADHYRHRFFYVEPMIAVGDSVLVGKRLGTVQSLQKRYAGIIDHVHLEIKHNGEFISWPRTQREHFRGDPR